MGEHEFPVSLQEALQPAWGRYVDAIAPHRPALHRYCVRLTGSLWDGEDLAQDTLVRVFAMLGKRWKEIENPGAYLARVATNVWIDATRRRARERAWLAREVPAAPAAADPPGDPRELRAAAHALLERLAPRERAAVLLKDVFDLSLEETASILRTSVAAVKAALHRGRERLEHDAGVSGSGTTPAAAPRELVERFVAAFNARDLSALRDVVSVDARVELVGGNEMNGAEDAGDFFAHALARFPGEVRDPRFEAAEVEGEWVVLGFRVRDGVEGLNDASRLEASDGRIDVIRCYCWCPETIAALAERIGRPALPRPYRSPTPDEIRRLAT